MNSDKAKALELAISQIDRHFGNGSVMKMGEENHDAKVQSIPSGSISLDSALGIGGVPMGRITEIFGNESSGKTTLDKIGIATANNIERKIQRRSRFFRN